jgi:hypothetical protein
MKLLAHTVVAAQKKKERAAVAGVTKRMRKAMGYDWIARRYFLASGALNDARALERGNRINI